jgi:phage terminase large subunit GpA-like protein
VTLALEVLRPPPNLTISQWSDSERRLSPESSAEPGPWRTTRAEYQRGFMDAFSDAKVPELVGVFASQTGKTDCVLNMIGARIATRPGPMLVIQPTLDMAQAWSKDRLSPMLRDTPALAGKVRDARSRDSGNTTLHKLFPSGHLTASGANSPANLAMRPIRDLYCDEIDRYPSSAGTEGDPVKLADTRTRAFWNRKRVYISSPGTRGASRLEVLWNRSDQRLYYVPCPDCGKRQTLKWSQVAWEKDDRGEHKPETAAYACEHCGCLWSDLQRRRAVAQGEWKASKPFRGCAGFHINALAAPWESCNLEHLVAQWLEAQGNPELLKVFINTVLAEWWEDSHYAKTVDPTGLLDRREPIPNVPAACALLTAGVDEQEYGFEISVYAWGSGEESWLLEHKVLHGDPSAEAIWQDLDAYLMRPWPRALGGVDFIRGSCIDSGHNTQRVYDFCGPRFRRVTPDGGRSFVFAIKGQAGVGELWPRQASKVSTKVPLWPLRVDAGKRQIYGRLSIAEPGLGYIHLNDSVDREFVESLVSEKLETTVNRKGFPVESWRPKRAGIRTEKLDCAVYAYAALCGLRAMGFDLEGEVANLGRRVVFDPAPPTPVAPVPTPAPQGAPRRTSGGGGWLGETRGWLGR